MAEVKICLVKLSGTPYIVSPLKRAVNQHANKSTETTTALKHRIALNL